MPKSKTQKNNPSQTKQDQILLGVDFGEKNIGVALGRNGLVAPLKIIAGTNPQAAIHELSRLGIENKITKFVLGLPLTSEGKETQKSIEVRKFAKLLKILSKKPVVFKNEHSTTKKSTSEAIKIGIPQRGRKKIDHLAAALILKRYFSDQE